MNKEEWKVMRKAGVKAGHVGTCRPLSEMGRYGRFLNRMQDLDLVLKYSL